MSITVFCPQCRESLELPEDYLGRSVRCGACSSVFTAAAAPDVPVAKPNRPTRNKPIPVSRPGDDGPIEYDEEKRQRRRRKSGCGVWVILGSLALLGCGCCGVFGYLIFAMMNPDFTPYTSPDGRFRAKFPNDVRTSQRVTGRANESAQCLEATRPLIQEMFFLYYVDLTPADLAKPPSKVVQELAKGLMDTSTANGGRPQNRNPAPITHQGYDATDLIIHIPSTRQYTQARVVVADGRGYVIGVTGPGKPDGSPWVEEFLESLEIVPQAVKDENEKKPEADKKPDGEKKPEMEKKPVAQNPTDADKPAANPFLRRPAPNVANEKPAVKREKAPQPRTPISNEDE